MNPQLNDEALNGITLTERARAKQLPDSLYLVDVVRLYFPDPESQVERDDGVKADTLRRNRRALTKTLIDACNNGLLNYKPGSPPKLFLDYLGPYSRPNAPHEVFKMFPGGRYKDRPPCNEWAIIHKGDYKTYLQNSEQWPVDGLIANWWPDDEQKIKAVGDDENRPKRDPERDEDYLAWIDKDTRNGKMSRKDTIEALTNRDSDLWSYSKYNEWHKNQNIISNKTPGPKPRIKRPSDSATITAKK